VILDLQLPDMTGFEWLERMESAAGGDRDSSGHYLYRRELTEEENWAAFTLLRKHHHQGREIAERLLDEVTLFLHSVESTLSSDQQEIIRMQHDPDQVLQGRTVLLVDDDLRNTFALSKLLRNTA